MEDPAQRIIRSSTPVREFDNLDEVAAVAVFPDRRRMATNSSDGMLRVWDLKTGVMLKELEGRGDAMRDMALSRDGQIIACSDESGYVIAWHIETGRALTPAFRAHSGDIWSMDFSPDGSTLATAASNDNTIKLWSTATWQPQGPPMNCDYHYVNCIRYSPSGEFLAIATDRGISTWNAATSQSILCFGIPSVSLVWTPDGTRLLSGDRNDITIREWDRPGHRSVIFGKAILAFTGASL
ncbi:WD40 repeat-like protein [Rhizopogon vinicolor AM-OR11-026]|uniref:WD40 repeat-like protein n=1 Tax=Rhizopogon vinicolor AM-OR11-026 TaxID=1314800 RepID=A0A1B7NGY4_9AGAM|nr:WD40 repeat-like protein [Rhizopogon vinicolor AM-OR11-026]